MPEGEFNAPNEACVIERQQILGVKKIAADDSGRNGRLRAHAETRTFRFSHLPATAHNTTPRSGVAWQLLHTWVGLFWFWLASKYLMEPLGF